MTDYITFLNWPKANYMDYIISGGLGFIGKNLSIKLSKSNRKFKILDKLCGQDVCLRLPGMEKTKKFVHLAAFTNVRLSIKNPKMAINENVAGIINCIEFAKKCGAHFIYTSSQGAPAALSPYSASKLAGESICNAFRESYGLDATTLRLSNVYGPHSKHKGSVIPAFIKRCLDRRDIKIYGNGMQTRDFIHVDDVVNTIINCSKQKLINVASGTSISILELAEIIRDLSDKIIGFRPNIEWEAPIKGEITKVDTSTDISQTVLLEEGLKSTFEWFKDHSTSTERVG